MQKLTRSDVKLKTLLHVPVKDIFFKIGSHEIEFKGINYLLDFALPNFYFHVVTAYNILRHNGVPVGKLDYIGKKDL